ncbi:MAG: radical SAM protein, partial [bacterium]|nr:radical SAM protein [bacterium]
PLTVVGGPVASINPLPLSPAIDVFVLGAAELLWPDFIRLLKENPSRDDLLDHLAAKDGFFVPNRHLDGEGRPRHRVRRCEKRDFHMVQEDLVPASHIVTPHTEYAGRGLIEMSRGCPEKCRYCWVSFNYGRLRCYSKAGILRRVRQLQKTTNRVGFVATAVGDHPDLDEILETCADLGLNTAISSLRIPALRPEILRPLARCGSRSITIAPETGSEDLRRSLGKPITNQQILVALETAQSCGIPGLKIYFIVGLPNETEGDVVAIADLVRQARSIMDRAGRGKGSTVPLHVGVSVLVPKPYTPFQHVPMMDAKTSRKRVRLLSKLIRQIPNTRLSVPSYREAVWQCLLSRGTRNAFEALQIATDGASTAEVLKQHSEQVRQATLEPQGHPPLWQFIASAPQKESALSCD